MYCVMCFFQLNMVCDRAVLKSNGQMAFFGGLLTGSLLTGMISDRYGQEHTGKCIRRFGGIYAYCRYFIDRKW